MGLKPPPEADLIARKRTDRVPRMSRDTAARRAGISETRWRQLETGRIRVRGRDLPETAPAETLARMAWAVGVTPEELDATGRPDAAVLLQRLIADAPGDALAAEVRSLAERIAAERGMSEGQKRRVTERMLRALEDDTG